MFVDDTCLQVSISPFSALSNLALMSTNNLMMNDDKSKIIQIAPEHELV